MPDTAASFPSCYGAQQHGWLQSDIGSGSKMNKMNMVACLYQTKLAGQCRIVTITWYKNLMGAGLSVSIDEEAKYVCKVDLRPWRFWKKQGSKSLDVSGHAVGVFWDLSTAKYAYGGPEPTEGFYVAIACDDEVVLLVGDKEAYRKIRDCRPASIVATLISRREHLFGKKYFTTRAQLCEGGQAHEIMIECGSCSKGEPKLCIRIDRNVVVQVKRLMWKFRGNHTIVVDAQAVEVSWDVHDWFFDPSSGHGLFMFQTPNASDNRPWHTQVQQVHSKSQPLQQQQQQKSLGAEAWSSKSQQVRSWGSDVWNREPQSGFTLLLDVWRSE